MVLLQGAKDFLSRIVRDTVTQNSHGRGGHSMPGAFPSDAPTQSRVIEKPSSSYKVAKSNAKETGPITLRKNIVESDKKGKARSAHPALSGVGSKLRAEVIKPKAKPKPQRATSKRTYTRSSTRSSSRSLEHGFARLQAERKSRVQPHTPRHDSQPLTFPDGTPVTQDLRTPQDHRKGFWKPSTPRSLADIEANREAIAYGLVHYWSPTYQGKLCTFFDPETNYPGGIDYDSGLGSSIGSSNASPFGRSSRSSFDSVSSEPRFNVFEAAAVKEVSQDVIEMVWKERLERAEELQAKRDQGQARLEAAQAQEQARAEEKAKAEKTQAEEKRKAENADRLLKLHAKQQEAMAATALAAASPAAAKRPVSGDEDLTSSSPTKRARHDGPAVVAPVTGKRSRPDEEEPDEGQKRAKLEEPRKEVTPSLSELRWKVTCANWDAWLLTPAGKAFKANLPPVGPSNPFAKAGAAVMKAAEANKAAAQANKESQANKEAESNKEAVQASKVAPVAATVPVAPVAAQISVALPVAAVIPTAPLALAIGAAQSTEPSALVLHGDTSDDDTESVAPNPGASETEEDAGAPVHLLQKLLNERRISAIASANAEFDAMPLSGLQVMLDTKRAEGYGHEAPEKYVFYKDMDLSKFTALDRNTWVKHVTENLNDSWRMPAWKWADRLSYHPINPDDLCSGIMVGTEKTGLAMHIDTAEEVESPEAGDADPMEEDDLDAMDVN